LNPILSDNLVHQLWIASPLVRGPKQRRFPDISFRDFMKTRQLTWQSTRKVLATDPVTTVITTIAAPFTHSLDPVTGESVIPADMQELTFLLKCVIRAASIGSHNS
jgi:hypothetical protein